MQVHAHNTSLSWCVMFEKNNINSMNPHDNKIMQHNYEEKQKKSVFWKSVFFCLHFIITTQQNTVAYSYGENFPRKNILFKRKKFCTISPRM